MNRIMSYRHFLLGLLSAIFTFCALQTNGQAFEPENLGDSINSPYDDVNPVFSPSGDTLYFSRINSPENRYGADNSQDIYISVRKEDGTWGKAVRLSDSVNLARYNTVYAVLEDGSLLISGTFNGKGTKWVRRGFSLLRRNGAGGWQKPVPIKVPWFYSRNAGDASCASLTPDRKFLFMSYSTKFGSNRQQLFVAKAKNAECTKYTKAKKLKGPMQKFYSAEAPHYNSIQRRLYFSGVNGKTKSSNYDMFYVVPAADSAASANEKFPYINWKDSLGRLSDTVNSTSWDSYYRPSDSAFYAIFCSDREGGMGKSDIYYLTLVEPRPWVKVTGRIIDSYTGKLLPLDREPIVHVNGAPSDSVLMSLDSSTFVALLPLDSLYRFTTVVNHFTSDTVDLDVREVKFYREDTVTLHVKSVPYVELTGRLLSQLSNTPLPRDSKPTVLIDGKPCDSLKIDYAKGTYQVKLPFGQKYILTLNAVKHKPGEQVVDLTEHHYWTTVEQDLYARPIISNMVTLTGRIINTKTGSPLEPGHEVQMKVNHSISQDFSYKDANATYKLQLPPGYDYDLVPRIKNFYNKLEVVDLRKAKNGGTVKRDFYVTPLEVGQSVDIENIYFETGKAVLKPSSFRSLNALVEFFQEYPNVVVEIGGHTDNTGGAAINRRLSGERAKAVAEYMIEQGIGRERFTVKGYGPDKPKASNKTKKGRAKNRRVDFTIVGI